MKYLGAYLLATLGGNESPSAKDILKILGAGGLDCDMEDANKVVDALAGKSIAELIEEGKKKLSSVPSGGSAAPAAAPAAGGGGGSAPKDAPRIRSPLSIVEALNAYVPYAVSCGELPVYQVNASSSQTHLVLIHLPCRDG
ncbi:hypothetical protein Y032_0011g1230 [Ancylostoma ceylanicum]|uniref:Large ribosomal subunit protein P2 n=1 Tax=Ancylostoma ceylanicum TaxID=53326 RepID=A0A016VEM1_9BILA|nr:hypothetical protein Y032_0011g1230 [Ancylostoma ceylanicum]